MTNPNRHYRTLSASLAEFEATPEGQELLAHLDAKYGPAAQERHKRVAAMRERRETWKAIAT